MLTICRQQIADILFESTILSSDLIGIIIEYLSFPRAFTLLRGLKSTNQIKKYAVIKFKAIMFSDRDYAISYCMTCNKAYVPQKTSLKGRLIFNYYPKRAYEWCGFKTRRFYLGYYMHLYLDGNCYYRSSFCTICLLEFDIINIACFDKRPNMIEYLQYNCYQCYSKLNLLNGQQIYKK